MKKLLTLTTTVLLLLAGTAMVEAKPQYRKKGAKPWISKKKGKGLYNGHYNRRGVYIYHTTRLVRKRRGLYENTYKHKIFPSGRKKTKLISSIFIRPYWHRPRVFYRNKVVYRGWKKYLVTYKIKKFQNGRVKRKIVKVKRIYYNY